MVGYGQQVGSMHPAGIHSCFKTIYLGTLPQPWFCLPWTSFHLLTMLPIRLLENGRLVLDLKVFLLVPATKLRQGNVFTPVCHSFCSWRGCVSTSGPGGRVVCHIPQADTPWADTHPLVDSPVWQTPPPCTVHGIRSTSGRCASYWNAFLLSICS